MQTNRNVSVWRRALSARTLLVASAIAVMVAVLPGATCVQPQDACSGNPCDDDVYCNGEETCAVDDATSLGYVCSNGTNPCADSNGAPLCNEANDSCVECLTAADCDDATFCNGAETCVSNACVAGSNPCAADESCDEATDTCVPSCTTDADCPDDTNFCNGAESCNTTTGLCVSSGDPCVGSTGLPVCNETDDTCVECLTNAQCDTAAGETCVANVCTPAAPACNSNGDCVDDNIFCNGDEFCDTSGVANACGHTGDPCVGTSLSQCNETTDSCELGGDPGNTIPLTDAIDVVNETFTPPSTTNNDTIIGTNDTFNTGDFVDGLGGNDRFNLIFTAAEADLVDVQNVERIFIRNTQNNQSIDVDGFTGYDEIWYDRGNQELEITNVHELATFGITGGDGVGSDSDFTVDVDEELAEGDDDAVSLALNGAEADDFTVEDSGGEGFETINLALTGSSTLTSITSADSATLNITGAGSLDLANAITGVDTVDGSAATGDLTLLMANEDVTVTTGSGDDEVTFGTGQFNDDDIVDLGDGDDTLGVTLSSSVNQPADVTGVETLSIQGDDDGNAEAFTFDMGGFDGLTGVEVESQGAAVTADTLTLDDADFGFDVTYVGDGTDANQAFDNITADFVGAGGSDDSLAVSFNNDGEDLDDGSRTVALGTLDIDDIENVAITLADGGVVTLAALNGQEVEELTIDNPGENLFTITAALESDAVTLVDASASVGGVSVDISNSTEDAEVTGGEGDDVLVAGQGEDVVTGGEGDDTLSGDDAADELTGGEGDDTLNGGDGVDELTGGADADTYQFDAANVDATDADNINGFTVGGGNDVLAIDVSAAGGGVAANLADNALVNIAGSADNSFIVDDAGTGYANFAAAQAAVQAANAATLDYAVLFFNTTTSRVELYIDDTSAAGSGILLAYFEDIDNDGDADDFLADFTAGNYDTY